MVIPASQRLRPRAHESTPGARRRVIGTVRRPDAVADLTARNPDTFQAELLEVTDAKRSAKSSTAASLMRADRRDREQRRLRALRAAEELSDEQVERILDTNLLGSIALIRAALPHLRAQAAVASSRSPPTAGRWLPREFAVPRHQVGHRGLR